MLFLKRAVNGGHFSRRGRSTEGAFSKRAVHWGCFFEEGGRARVIFEEGGRLNALFRRGQSTEGAFSKRAVDWGRFFEEGGRLRTLLKEDGLQKQSFVEGKTIEGAHYITWAWLESTDWRDCGCADSLYSLFLLSWTKPYRLVQSSPHAGSGNRRERNFKRCNGRRSESRTRNCMNPLPQYLGRVWRPD